jgi:predicted RNA-binding protein YlxR (DUF448 family)
MRTCRICGEEKDDKEFYRLKHFAMLMKMRHIWCRDCMKMYIQMKEKEKVSLQLQEATAPFIVDFK